MGVARGWQSLVWEQSLSQKKCLWRVSTAWVCLFASLEGGALELWLNSGTISVIIKGQIFDFSISTGLALGHEELAIHESNKIGDKNLNRLHVHIVCRWALWNTEFCFWESSLWLAVWQNQERCCVLLVIFGIQPMLWIHEHPNLYG